jgi:4-amino-4-deoxy-L-arabinose transferase-like glycosyltransferase
LDAEMSRPSSFCLVIACWAAIYLPALGSLEIKGEEGRRILPAVTMLDTGNYLVPQVGSEPYYRKPPLVNWLVAVSFKVTGARNEWTARFSRWRAARSAQTDRLSPP